MTTTAMPEQKNEQPRSTTNGTNGAWQGEYHPFELGTESPEALRGKVIRIRKAQTLDEVRALIGGDNQEDKDYSLAQAASITIRGGNQRRAKDASKSEEVKKLLDAGDIDGAVAEIQRVSDAWTYEARRPGQVTTKEPGAIKVAKQKAAAFDMLIPVYANDPSLLKRLEKQGVDVAPLRAAVEEYLASQKSEASE